MIKILPSLMAAQQLNLEQVVKSLEAHCDGFHLDIMDDHFVPNLSFNIDTVNQLAQLTNKQLSIHLMVDKPEEMIAQLDLKKNNVITFHLESTDKPKRLIQEIHKKGLLTGIALRPKTPLSSLYPYIKDIDQILIMTVEPGFSGQPLMPEVLEKIDELANYKRFNVLFQPIAVDGGIDKNNIKQLADLGVEIFSVGSAIFESKDRVNALQELYERIRLE
jgi:ribulose-phosphate 3-epimerase